MTTRELIFSNERSVRIKRHLFFWLAWWLYFSILHAANSFGKTEIMYFNNIPFTFIESLLLLIPQLILAYTLLYIVLPRFALQAKYAWAISLTLLTWFLCGVITRYMAFHVNPVVLATILPKKYLVSTQRLPSTTFFMSLMANYKGAFTISGFAIGIKFVKNWHLKEQRNLQLQKENSEAQLQLLTAQVHPHFLFNTLNNIYSRAQIESPGSAKMIMELSHLLRFVMDEGNKMLVPLENEIQMITDYINLEKMRYDDKLELHVSMPQHTEDIYIAPLLLLPFIENAFKHGASKMIHKPWINLKLSLHHNTLTLKLMNGRKHKQSAAMQQQRQGIGLENVKKRLALLYKGNYDLHINEDNEVFIVNLRIELLNDTAFRPVQVHVTPREAIVE